MHMQQPGTAHLHTFSAALDEEPVCHLHDVGLVYCCDLVAAVVTCVLECIFSYSGTGNSCDNL